MLDCGERAGKRRDTPRRGDQRIAAADDHLPDARIPANVVESRRELGAGERGAGLADGFAPEAEPAIDGTARNEFEEDTIGIAVDHAGNGLVDIVADRVGAFLGATLELSRVGEELAARSGRRDRRDR